jgi:hypothetical protein
MPFKLGNPGCVCCPSISRTECGAVCFDVTVCGGTPLLNALVRIVDSVGHTYEGFTDADGHLCLVVDYEDYYTWTISATNCLSSTGNVHINCGGETVTISVDLEVDSDHCCLRCCAGGDAYPILAADWTETTVAGTIHFACVQLGTDFCSVPMTVGNVAAWNTDTCKYEAISALWSAAVTFHCDPHTGANYWTITWNYIYTDEHEVLLLPYGGGFNGLTCDGFPTLIGSGAGICLGPGPCESGVTVRVEATGTCEPGAQSYSGTIPATGTDSSHFCAPGDITVPCPLAGPITITSP